MAEDTRMTMHDAGGFVVPSLPSPAPSTTTQSSTGLPHPRGHPLRPGSAKEDRVRNFVAERMAYVSRRFIKRTEAMETPCLADDVAGYKSASELCKDLEQLISIIWLTGTRKHHDR